MDIISLTTLFGIIGLLCERTFKAIRKSRCNHIHSKCCGSEIDIEREVEDEKKI